MRPQLLRRLRAALPSAVLALTIYVPLLLTRPGRVGADTKSYLYLDPGRMLSRAPTMWDPNIGLGTVTHQNIGYLWPIGPFYWVADVIGLPDWVAQRLWLGSILFLAGLGVRFMLKAMGQEGPHVTAATFCYALTPYVLTLAARLSVILLPYAGLPWLLGLTVMALRRRRWSEPALFALVVATIGSVNATALILVGTAPVLWIVHEVVITREVRFRDAAAAVGRIAVLTVACSLWWLSGLWAQGGYGIEILRYTETAQTVAMASVSLEVLRGLGYWFFYGEDRFGPWIAPSSNYMSRPELIAASYLIPGLGLIGLAVARFRERVFFAALLVLGVFLAVGAHPWADPPPAAAGIKAFLESDVGLAMRSLPRAGPLVVLALSVFVGSLIASITAERARLARPMTAVVVLFAVLALPPLWQGQFVDANLDRPEEIPSYWHEAARALDARGSGTRVLEVPGSDFASYRWGNTVDPVLPGLMDRPYVARELIPYGSPPSADLLGALDHRLQESTFDAAALAPIARFMGVGDISVRSDLTYERYNTPRPRLLWDLLTNAPQLSELSRFGPSTPNTPRADIPLLDETELLTPASLPDPPAVGVLAIDDPEQIVRTAPATGPVILAGDGDGLVDAASVGLVDGHELVLYSGSYASDTPGLQEQIGRNAALILTDTNRRAAQRWSTVRDNQGIIEQAGQEPLVRDPKDQRLEIFPDGGDDQSSVRDVRGGVWAEASSYGNTVSLTPEDDPANAVDGSQGTAWRTGGFSSATGERLRIHYLEPMTTDAIRVLQAIGGVRNRFITKVEIRLDDGEPLSFDLDAASREEGADAGPDAGQVLQFPLQSFSTLDITITGTDPGQMYRYDGVSGVGFAEVVAVDRDGSQPVADDVVRLPVDLLDAAGKDSLANPLAVVLTRQRVAGTVAVRSSPEQEMARSFSLPTDRSFALSGQVRLSTASLSDHTIDRVLGLAGFEDGGVTATSRRRLPGGLTTRAMAAIDGDLDTWYSPGFLDQHGEYLDFHSATQLRFDHLAVTVVNDGRHSVPRALRIEVDGQVDPDLVVDLPEIPDQEELGAQHTFQITLPRQVSGHQVRLVVPESPDDPEATVRDVTTLDWFTGSPVVMPIGIAEVDIDGLHAPTARPDVAGTCRSDLLQVDGEPVLISLQGTTADLLAGQAIDLTGCDEEPIVLDTGEHTIRTGTGALTGLDLDRLVLRSSAGGTADDSDAPIAVVDTAGRPGVTVDHSGRTDLDLTVSGADDRFWLVLGQSHNAGWTATADGHDLGPPTLVNGYANGWEVPAGDEIHIHLEWTPQKVVWGALASSALAVIVAIGLIAWPRRRPAFDLDVDGHLPLDARPSMPKAFQWSRVLRYAGPAPSRFAVVATTAGSTVLGWTVIGTAPGVALGAMALLTLKVGRARPVLTFGAPLVFAMCVGWLLADQVVRDLPSGFDWPTYFEEVHRWALLAVGMGMLDTVVDRCWLRRWWPSNDSPA